MLVNVPVLPVSIRIYKLIALRTHTCVCVYIYTHTYRL